MDSAGAGLRVLLVEDDPDIRRMLADLLEERGHRVDAYGDGTAAWEALQAETFPLAVLDVRLPDEDGIGTRMNDLSEPAIRTTPRGDGAGLQPDWLPAWAGLRWSRPAHREYWCS